MASLMIFKAYPTSTDATTFITHYINTYTYTHNLVSYRDKLNTVSTTKQKIARYKSNKMHRNAVIFHMQHQHL